MLLETWFLVLGAGFRNRVSSEHLVRMRKCSQKPGFLDGWAIIACGINSPTIAKNIAFPPFEEWESIN
ncbi:MAG: hypothetical protein U7126_31490 [Microcoleus sp.]